MLGRGSTTKINTRSKGVAVCEAGIIVFREPQRFWFSSVWARNREVSLVSGVFPWEVGLAHACSPLELRSGCPRHRPAKLSLQSRAERRLCHWRAVWFSDVFSVSRLSQQRRRHVDLRSDPVSLSCL